MGAAVRATVDDAQMARGVGIDTSRISMLIFALGAFLAALGGVIGGAFLGIYPGLDFEMLPLAFAVVIIGGMGSLGGAAIGALVVGLADNFGKALFPGDLLLHALRADGADPRGQADRICSDGSEPAPMCKSDRQDRWSSWWRWPSVAIIVPNTNSFVILLATRALAFAILVMSLDILLGYTGLASLGQAAYLGVGAYLDRDPRHPLPVRAGLGFLAGGRARHRCSAQRSRRCSACSRSARAASTS